MKELLAAFEINENTKIDYNFLEKLSLIFRFHKPQAASLLLRTFIRLKGGINNCSNLLIIPQVPSFALEFLLFSAS